VKLPFVLLPAAVAALSACTGQSTDPPSTAKPSAYGTALRIKDVMNPAAHTQSNAIVSISGAAFLWVDTFDETRDGKSVGTVFVQDAESQAPYSGASLYQPQYVPASLRLSPGDVIDMPTATYVADSSIGTATFDPGTFLIQFSKPDVTFRFDSYAPPVPAQINIDDLNQFDSGNQWNAMLVTVNNVTFKSGLQNANGRVTAYLTSINAGTVELSNELFDVASWNNAQVDAGGGGGAIATGKTITSLTGIVTWFEGYHIAPRSPADIVP
jgi:hypothetical protein